MSGLGEVLTFAANLYRQRARSPMPATSGANRSRCCNCVRDAPTPIAFYEQIRAAARSPRSAGRLASASYRVCGAVLRDRRFGTRPEDGTKVDEMDLSFLGMNPPDHTRLRRLAPPAFSPKAVASYAERIESTVAALLDRASAAGQFDLVSGFAAPLPIAVITDLLGIPDADSAAFTRYGALIGSALGGIRSLRHAAQLAASEATLVRLFESLFELRRREPRDDIVSRLRRRRRGPDQAGRDAADVRAAARRGLRDHGQPDRQQRARPARSSRAVAGALRRPGRPGAEGGGGDAAVRPPVQLTTGFALQPVELEGTVPAQGPIVAVLIGGANRDPRSTTSRTPSTSTATARSATSRSPAASTTAWGSRSRAWRRRSRCACWPSGCPTCPLAGRSGGATASSSAARSASR